MTKREHRRLVVPREEPAADEDVLGIRGHAPDSRVLRDRLDRSLAGVADQAVRWLPAEPDLGPQPELRFTTAPLGSRARPEKASA